MNKQQELERIQSLSIEERAAEPKKSISCFIPLCICLIGFVFGVIYWFGTDYIFSYRSVGPFWGFVLLTVIGLSIAGIVSLIYKNHWAEFNKIIKSARKEILDIIKSGQATDEELERYKKIYIESKIGDEPLTEEEFEWHSTHYCWGCGEKQTSVPMAYTITKERTERWQEGAFKYSRTFKHSAKILICPKCYSRLTCSDKVSEKNGDLTSKIFIALIIIVAITTFALVLISEINDDGSIPTAIGFGLLGAFLAIGVSLYVGRLILYPLAILLSLPFANFKGIDYGTKWNFDEIPSVRDFLDRDLPHTK